MAIIGWSDDRLIETADLDAGVSFNGNTQIPAQATNGYIFVASEGIVHEIYHSINPANQITFYSEQSGRVADTAGTVFYVYVTLGLQVASLAGQGYRIVADAASNLSHLSVTQLATALHYRGGQNTETVTRLRRVAIDTITKYLAGADCDVSIQNEAIIRYAAALNVGFLTGAEAKDPFTTSGARGLLSSCRVNRAGLVAE